MDGCESSTRTADVLLRDAAQGDLPVMFEHQRDPVANGMSGVPPRDRGAFEAHWARMLADRAFTNKAVLFEGRVAGHVMSFERGGHREVGYWIAREHWGKGVDTEALSQFLARAEARRPLRDASRGVGHAVAERLGHDGVVVNHRPEHGNERVRAAGVGGRPREEPAGVAR